MTLKRAGLLLAIVITLLSVASADAIDRANSAHIARALTAVRNEDDFVRGFVEFFLRTAGIAWAAVEWVAAVYLMRGYAMLRGWFAEDAK